MWYGAKTHLHSGRGGTAIACVLLPKPARQHKLVIELHIAKYRNFFAFKTVSNVWISLRGSTEEGKQMPCAGSVRNSSPDTGSPAAFAEAR